jgi:Zn-dependent protease/CBS domain-containing protein
VKNTLRLGKIFGIEIRLDYSWFIIFALVTWSLSTGHFPMYRWPASVSWVVGILGSVLFFASILAHELGHSFVAIRRNVPVRSITLFIFGGIAQISKEPERPRDEFLIAIAGPIVSAGLGLLYLAVPALFLSNATQPAGALGVWLGTINLSLAAFNLIPGFPLDGGRILRSIVWGRTGSFRKATQISTGVGQFVAYAFIFIGIGLFFAGRLADGLWIAFIGWFLNNAAIASYQQVTMKEQLSGITARSAMMTDCPRVRRDLTLHQLVHDFLIKDMARCFPVVEDGRTYGIVTQRHVRAYPPEQWRFITVGRAMTPFEETKTVNADMELIEVMKFMTDEDLNEVPVVEGGHLIGMISRDRLLHFITVRTELGKAA